MQSREDQSGQKAHRTFIQNSSYNAQAITQRSKRTTTRLSEPWAISNSR